MSDDSHVTFTVKELLAQLKDEMILGFARIEHQVTNVNGQLDELKNRVEHLERARSRDSSFLRGVSRPLVLAAGFVAWVAPMLVVLFK